LTILPQSVQRVAPGGRQTSKSASLVTYIPALCALRNAAGNNIDADPPVHHPLRTSSLAACIKVLPVLTRPRVLVKVLGRVLE